MQDIDTVYGRTKPKLQQNPPSKAEARGSSTTTIQFQLESCHQFICSKNIYCYEKKWKILKLFSYSAKIITNIFTENGHFKIFLLYFQLLLLLKLFKIMFSVKILSRASKFRSTWQGFSHRFPCRKEKMSYFSVGKHFFSCHAELNYRNKDKFK